MKTLRHLLSGWTWRMAWRDSRNERRRLLVFSMAIVFGIAALVAISSLNRNLSDSIETEAKQLLGADLMINSRRAFVLGDSDGSPEQEAAKKVIADLPGERAIEISLTSMVFFPRTEDSKFVNFRGIDSGYPFYGEITTDPPQAWQHYRAGEGVILDAVLASRYGVQLGDMARIGAIELPVLGVLVDAPPQASAFAAIAPQVFVPRERLADTGLLGARSMTYHKIHFRLPDGVVAEDLMKEPQKQVLRLAGVRYESVAGRKRSLGRTLENLYAFFSLIGFIALLLGGVGVASAIHVHIAQRLKTVATLRCLGASPAQATAVFLAQGIALGLLGSLLGVLFGVALQQWVPPLFEESLPFDVEFSVVPSAVAMGLGIGFLVSICFTLIPLCKVRRVSPLAALRSDADDGLRWYRDPLAWLAGGAVVFALGVLAFAMSPEKLPWLGLWFMIGLIVIVIVLALVAKLIMWMARKVVRPRWPYVLRQGLANLYRPRNQTGLFLLSAGLGLCLVLTLYLVQSMLVEQIGSKALAGKADTYLIDVRPDQRDGVLGVFQSLGLEKMDEAPVVTARLKGVKGKLISEMSAQRRNKLPRWTLRNDFRCTYRSELMAEEKLERGEWIGEWRDKDPSLAIPMSVEEGIAKQLKIDVGDAFSLEVAGEVRAMKVASIRKVEWENLGLNFLFVFPAGVLEGAAGFNLMTTSTPTEEVSGSLGRELGKRFPNITVFDASMVVDAILEIVTQVGLVIRFMALFTVFTGTIILIGTILSGKKDRVGESVLLRTLGASRRQIWRILLTEYFLLGLFAALTGALLSLVASWALATFVFKLDFLGHATPVIVAVLALAGATVLVGLLMSRGITRQPPLAILRAEGR